MDTSSSSSTSSSEDCLQIGTRLWVPCEKQGWCAGVVVEAKEERQAVVKLYRNEHHEHLVVDPEAADSEGRPVYLPRAGDLLSEEDAKSVEDLSLLPVLAEPEILHTLNMRYGVSDIYTCAGPMLLAVNPYKDMPGLYDHELLHKFATVPHGCPAPMPHIFGIARDAFLGIQHTNTSQTLLVSGESGAGKTETVKLMMKFLAHAGGRNIRDANTSLDHRVLLSAPLLEALGNARTTTNDNSSRFGKFTELRFQRVPDAPGPCIVEAKTHTYLLEKVRVTDLKEGEHCFHVFHQILAAAARARAQASDERAVDGGGSPLSAAQKKISDFMIKNKTTVKDGRVSNVDWDDVHSEWRVTWMKQGKERSKVFKPCTFLEEGMTSDGADTAALKAAIDFRNDLVFRDIIKAPRVPLSSSLPTLAFLDHDLCELTKEKFRFLARSPSELLPRVDEAKNFDRTVEALRAFHVNDDEISQVVSAIIAVLYLGNIEIEGLPGNAEASDVKQRYSIDGPLCRASVLLGVSSESLATALCTRVIQVRGERSSIRKGRTTSEAEDGRDALARHLYGMVFAYVVSRINESLAESERLESREATSLPSIGLLDIFGFEVFENNGFEQLCINYANEMLQEHFTMVVFEHELALYEAEAVLCDPDEVAANKAAAEQHSRDSRAILTGVFSILDEECSINSSRLTAGNAAGTTDSWLYKVAMTMTYETNNKAFQLVHQRTGHFIVSHFAGRVEYCADAFLAKNRDTLSAEVVECIGESSKSILQEQCTCLKHSFGTNVSTVSGRVPQSKTHTVSSHFRDQLEILMTQIRDTHSRYVQCIKPNQSAAANMFDCSFVLRQLRCQGVIEAARVARVGYAVRLGHKQSVLIYRMLAPRNLRSQLEEWLESGMHREAAQAFFTHLKESLPGISHSSIQVGKTLTFLKMHAMEVLGFHLCKRRESSSLQVQKSMRRYFCARHYARIRKSNLRLQALGRTLQARKLLASLRRERRAATTLQAWRRGKEPRRHFQQVVKAVICIQRWYRRRVSARSNRLRAAALLAETVSRLSNVRSMVEDAISRLSDVDPQMLSSQGFSISDELVSHELVSIEKAATNFCRKTAEFDRYRFQAAFEAMEAVPLEAPLRRPLKQARAAQADSTPVAAPCVGRGKAVEEIAKDQSWSGLLDPASWSLRWFD